MTINTDLQQRLERVAENATVPFCISCHVKAESGRCPRCYSDDLGRHLIGCGLDWGSTWAIPHLVAESIDPVDVDQLFEDWVSEAYSESVKVGWLELDVATTLKEIDPVSWNQAQSEWLDNETSDEILMSLDNGSTYYNTADVLAFVEDAESETEHGVDHARS
jgi:hypothetical protein